jgi:hypothetical protein
MDGEKASARQLLSRAHNMRSEGLEVKENLERGSQIEMKCRIPVRQPAFTSPL